MELHSKFTLLALMLFIDSFKANDASRDYYTILGLQRSASSRDVKKAFRKLALLYHPDKNKDPGAEEEFRKIAEAYDVLSNESKRQEYDRVGHQSYTQHPDGHAQPTFNMHDFFQQFDHFAFHRNHHAKHHAGSFHFDFGSLFEGDDDDMFGNQQTYSFAQEVHHSQSSHGQTCHTRTIRQGNTVITRTECHGG